ncbi:hypothetical protein POX_b03289 [Penicillium oxalicum]|uniref:Cytochrome P450 n=1 Tax=Penicillium oxalicum (strain 114-2 / CGMCC 5302) TaxID=933388 RepID=S7ZHE6_PENO1|nr:hypothetical protein POX_b03289 [Penicillium oxalicum]EPS29689.1 hypothetical protein PDE_04639 [Penicillium oxalicum 114-2]KAI2793237.1 hypothetical protein POX_b03289 [Penicillium oxalicum]
MIVYFLLGSTVACLLVIAIYRLHVHPLSNVPGPRLAALTGLYEVFCVAWCSESYDEEIDRMHRAYGPIIRIAPDEIHIQDHFYGSRSPDLWVKSPQHHESNGSSSRWHSRARGQSYEKRFFGNVQYSLHAKILGIIQQRIGKHQRDHFLSRKASSGPSTVSKILGMQSLFQFMQPKSSDLEGGAAAAAVTPTTPTTTTADMALPVVRGRSLSVTPRNLMNQSPAPE